MEKDKLQIALGAIEDLQAGSTKLASMLEEATKQNLTPAEQAELRSINTQIVSKLASMGELNNMSPDVAVDSLMHPCALAQMALDMLGRVAPSSAKEASAPLALGKAAERKQAQADAKPVQTKYNNRVRC